MKQTIIQNEIISTYLPKIRDRRADMESFRTNADKVITSLVEEVVGKEMKGKQSSSDFCVIIILRSAVAMLMPTIKLLPCASVGFVGVKRDEITAIPHEYYWNIPDITNKTILIPDPMLATGGSILHVVEKLKKLKANDIRIISVVSAPEGVKAINKAFPDIKIYTAALDSHLDAKKFIVPGLGDFGDRYFGTE